MKYLFIFLTYFLFKPAITHCQISNNNKRDTLYYILDTARIPLNDRIVQILNAPLFKFYYFRCQCLDEGQMPYLIHRTKESGEIVLNYQMNQFKTINIVRLLQLFHTDYLRFNNLYVIYLLEVLPDKRIIKHLVTTGAMLLSSKM